MDAEQTIRHLAIEATLELVKQGYIAADSTTANEDQVIAAAKKIADFINDGTVPTP